MSPLYEDDIENEIENITFIDETNIYSPLHIKTIIKEKYKLNDLQAIWFENFNANNQSYTRFFFWKWENNKDLELQHTLQMQPY